MWWDSAELFQVLKDDAIKVLHSICQQIWKTQQWLQDWKRSIFIPIPKKGNTKECSNYRTIALISHASKVMLKILWSYWMANIWAWSYEGLLCYQEGCLPEDYNHTDKTELKDEDIQAWRYCLNLKIQPHLNWYISLGFYLYKLI